MYDKILGIAAVGIASAVTNEASKRYIGVDMTTIVGAALGAAAAVGYDTSIRPHGRTFTLAFSTTITACLATGFFPKLLGWDWADREGAEAAVAGVAAVVFYYSLPPAGKRLGEIIKAFKLSDVLPRRRRRNYDEDDML